MNDQLKRKISDEYELPTSFMEHPPVLIYDRINTLCEILLKYPPPDNSKQAFLLLKSPESTRWITINDPFTVGQHKDNELIVSDDFVSSRHCQIFRDNTEWMIHDLNSTNGIYVNHQKVSEKVLRDGDMVQIGNLLMIFMGDN